MPVVASASRDMIGANRWRDQRALAMICIGLIRLLLFIGVGLVYRGCRHSCSGAATTWWTMYNALLTLAGPAVIYRQRNSFRRYSDWNSCREKSSRAQHSATDSAATARRVLVGAATPNSSANFHRIKLDLALKHLIICRELSSAILGQY